MGTLLVCDFNSGFQIPEMVKRRPVVVISPKISARAGLCTVVPLSTSRPSPKRDYHYRLDLDPPLPEPWNRGETWVKGDMVAAVGFNRLDFIRYGRDPSSQRRYRFGRITDEQLRNIRRCVLS